MSSGVEPAVIVAGAGSGKTTSMAARVAWLVGSGYVRPDQVLGLTFTTKATAQLLSSMRRSVTALVDEGIISGEDADGAPLGEPQVLTYHAFSARILAEHGIRLGREPRATMLTDGARQQLAYRVVCRSTLPLSGHRALAPRHHQGPAEPRRRAHRARRQPCGPADVRRRDARHAAVLRGAAEDRHRDDGDVGPAQRAGEPGRGMAGGEGRPRRARLRRSDPAGRRARGPLPGRRG